MREKFYRAHQISTAIIDIIDSSQKYCYLVSPFIKIWDLLDRVLEQASNKKKKIVFVLRDCEHNGALEKITTQFGFETYLIPNLHSKLYLNERKAIIGSMNLYDTSQSRNFELGVLVEGRHNINVLKKEIIEDDLLSAPNKKHFKSKYHREEQQLLDSIKKYQSSLSTKGFCVVCGEKIDFDESDKNHPTFVRCYKCYHKNEIEEYNPNIYYCHYCGKSHKSVVYKPLHSQCQLEWDQFKGKLELIR